MSNSECEIPREPAVENPDEIISLCHALRKLAQNWKLAPEEASALMGFSIQGWKEIEGDKLPDGLNSEQVTRAFYLIDMFADLRTVFHGPLTYGWPTHSNTGPGYEGRRPIDIMIEGGLSGIRRTWHHIKALGQGM